MSFKQLICPKCSKPVRVAETTPGGTTLKCPSCQNLFRLPAATPAVPAAPAAAKPAAPAAPRVAPAARPAAPAPVSPVKPAAPRSPVAATPRPKAPLPPVVALPPLPAPTLARPVPMQYQGYPPPRRASGGNMKWFLIGGGALATIAAAVTLILIFSRPGTQTAQNAGNTGQSGQRADDKKSDTKGDKKDDKKDGDGDQTPVIPVGLTPVEKVDPLAGKEDPFANLKPPEGKPWLVLDSGGHSAIVRAALFTPDGKKVITPSQDKTIRIWDIATGQTERIFHMPVGEGLEGALYAAALTKDGKKLAVGGVRLDKKSASFPFFLISMETGQIERVFRGHQGDVMYLAFSPDDKHVVSASFDQTCRIYEVESGRFVRELGGHAAALRTVSYSPDGQLLATVSRDKTARIWDANTGDTLAILTPPVGNALAHAWSPDSQTLVTGTQLGTVQLWDRKGKLIKNFDVEVKEKTTITALQFTRDGKELLYTGVGLKRSAGIFNLATASRRVFVEGHTNSVFGGSLSPNCELAATCGGNQQETLVWRVKDGSIVRRLAGMGKGNWAVGWSRDGKSIAWGTDSFRDKGVNKLEQSFDLTTLQFGPAPVAENFLRSQKENATGFVLKQTDFTKINASLRGKQIGNVSSPHENNRIYDYHVTADDRLLLGTAFGVFLFDLRTGKYLREYKAHSDMVTGVVASPDGKYYLSSSADQTVCIWSPERTEPMLRLFFVGTEWVAWTPEGYYACSANGERLMGWQINNGFEALGTYYDAVRFRQSLFRPEAIKQLVKLGDIKQALALTSGDKQKQPEQPVDVAKVLPPQVRIVAPTNATGIVKVADGKLTLTAAAKSVGQHPVTAMRLIVDGRPYRGEEGQVTFPNPQLGVRSATWNVTLPVGAHGVAVQAESAVSKSLSEPIFVTCEGTKPSSNMYVLAIGINSYPGPMRLNFAAQDATGLADMFRSKSAGLFNKVEVSVLTDKQATKANIVKGLAWMKQNMTAQDVGIFFFGGHGTRDPFGTFHLVPVDINVKMPAQTCLSGELVKKALGSMPGKIVCIFDACHSGAAATPDDLVRDLVTEDYGIIVMCSSLGTECSLESPAVEHGFFTVGLMEGLKGAADLDGDNVIYVHEVDQFTKTFVKLATNGQQNPITARPPSIPSFALTKKQ